MNDALQLHFKSSQVDELSVAVSYRELRTLPLTLTSISNSLRIYGSQLSLHSRGTDHTEITVLLLHKEDHRENESRDSYLASPLER
jgi:hypothetical protein